jgi:hypothetical protein
MKTLLWSLGFTLALAACGAPGRPSGLPPPEYEQPRVDPWPAVSETPATGGAPVSAPASPSAGVGVGPAPEEPAGLPQNAGGSGATLSPGTP